MRLIGNLLAVVAVAIVALHGYFYLQTGSIDPCEAAVTRLIQKDREQGQDLAAGIGMLFAQQLKDMMRTEGVMSCYRTALTGNPPEVTIKFDRQRDRPYGQP